MGGGAWVGIEGDGCTSHDYSVYSKGLCIAHVADGQPADVAARPTGSQADGQPGHGQPGRRAAAVPPTGRRRMNSRLNGLADRKVRLRGLEQTCDYCGRAR